MNKVEEAIKHTHRWFMRDYGSDTDNTGTWIFRVYSFLEALRSGELVVVDGERLDFVIKKASQLHRSHNDIEALMTPEEWKAYLQRKDRECTY